jgi:hypothetical protein
MRCFVHPDVEAVGTCRCCNRGLCRGCAVAEPGFLACKGECEKQARLQAALTDANAQAFRVARRGAWIMPALFAMFAAIFLYFGLTRYDSPVNVAVAMGVAMAIFAVAMFARQRRWLRAIKVIP